MWNIANPIEHHSKSEEYYDGTITQKKMVYLVS